MPYSSIENDLSQLKTAKKIDDTEEWQTGAQGFLPNVSRTDLQNGEDVGIIELLSELLKTVTEKVSMMIRLSRRLRGRNEGSSFLETLNLEHV